MGKICTKCLSEKDLNDFPVKQSSKDKRGSHCKLCFNEYHRNFYSKNSIKQKARVKKNKKQYRDRFIELKLQMGCQICGYKKSHYSLHFHHKNPTEKTANLNVLVKRNIGLVTLQKELDKCILLCANCHGEIEENK